MWLVNIQLYFCVFLCKLFFLFLFCFSLGASVLTEPIKFTLGEHHVTSATTTYSHAVGTISGIVASILAVLLAAAAIIFYRRHRANGKAATGVAFENPTYTRGLEQVQVSYMKKMLVVF